MWLIPQVLSMYLFNSLIGWKYMESLDVFLDDEELFNKLFIRHSWIFEVINHDAFIFHGDVEF